MPKIDRISDLPLESLVLGSAQARVRNVDREIDELADSIRIHGLLEPIVVCPANHTVQGDTYEILTGQRRFLAHKQLGRPTIWAAVLSERVDETTAKVLSLTENLIRRDLDSSDIIDICTALFKKYGTAKAVAEETGIPYQAVLKYVKYDRLDEQLRTSVDKGEVTLDAALRAQDVVHSSGQMNTTTAVELAKKLTGATGVQARRMVRETLAKSDAGTLNEVIERMDAPSVKQILVTLEVEEHRALQAYAKERGLTQDKAAAGFVRDAMAALGLVPVPASRATPPHPSPRIPMPVRIRSRHVAAKVGQAHS